MRVYLILWIGKGFIYEEKRKRIRVIMEKEYDV